MAHPVLQKCTIPINLVDYVGGMKFCIIQDTMCEKTENGDNDTVFI